MFLPDYRGGSIANLMSSVTAGLGGGEGTCPPLHLLGSAEAGAFRNLVLLVIDGLGYNYLCKHPEASWLNSHLRGPVTSVFPSTTATAITTFLTGEPPSQHGLTGWHMYFRELGSVIAVLPGRARYGGVGLADAGVVPSRLFSHSPLYDRLDAESFVVTPAYIANSDFNQAHLGSATLRPYRGLWPMLEIIGELVRGGDRRRFIYAYWPELDALGHMEGIHSAAAAEHLQLVDRVLAESVAALEGTDTLLVVTADHGQIDTTDADRILVEEHPDIANMLLLPLCGESRAAYAYLRSGREQAFERYVSDRLSHAADLHRSAELVAAGWFGPGDPHPRLGERIGDYTLVMKGHHVIKDWLPHETRHTLIGVHGGVSADEMRVPLVVWSG